MPSVPFERRIELPIPPAPNSQGLSSKTFKVPPLDGSLTLPEIWDWHLENSPHHPVFVYREDDGSEKTIYMRDAIYALHRAGRILLNRLPQSLADKRPVIAILAVTDTITYSLVTVGIARANCIIFPLSPRNSPAAVAHLLSETDAKHLLIGPELAMQNLAKASFEVMESQGLRPPESSTMPIFEDVVKLTTEADFRFLPKYDFRMEHTNSIYHSSGSSAFPKPIASWHYRNLVMGTSQFWGRDDLTGLRMGLHTLPIFHGWGSSMAGMAVTCGIILCTFPPRSPAVVPTPERTLKAIVDSKCGIAFCVPTFIETWAKKPEDVAIMRGIAKGIGYGGGPLNPEVGDQLADQGVNLFCMYGSTEAGSPHLMVPPPMGRDWAYMDFESGNAKERVHWIPQPDGTAEMIYVPSRHGSPAMVNTTYKGGPAFATGDLFVQHPTKPHLWRIYGRNDDQIMHSTGEKTNPGPLEAMLQQDPRVDKCLMFGRGHFNAGVLVDPKAAYKFDPTDMDKLAAFRNAIWPTVEKMNQYAPQHSRVFKEMILVTSPSKPFSFTAKGTPRRQIIIKEYDPEIEAIYAAADETTQASEVSPPESWKLLDVLDFVRLVVGRVAKTALADTDDFFQKGCDSLQATWIRNTILHALRKNISVDTRSIDSSFVYQFPTVTSLAQFVASVASLTKPHTNGVDGDSPVDAAVASMLAMVERHRINFPKHAPTSITPTKDIILVTGTTGSLGSAILSRLLETPDVEHIYALNRVDEDGKDLLQRQQDRLREWGFDPEIVHSRKVTLIQTDMSADHLGLEDLLYEKIRTSVTHIIHNAYRVNFNLSLASFEPNVQAARNLVDLALSSPRPHPPRLLFESSVGVLGRRQSGERVAEGPVEPSHAVSRGYSESKWVIERLLSIVEEETPLRPVTVRLGQIAGGSTGAWNRGEWFPSLVISSKHIGQVPTLSETAHVSWIPVDAAAQALIEMRNSSYPVLHLAHPRPVAWNTILSAVSRALNLPLVPYSKWIQTLKKSREGLSVQQEADACQANPALRLLDFFTGAKVDVVGEALGVPNMDLTKAVKVAPALSEDRLPQLNEVNVSKWLAYW